MVQLRVERRSVLRVTADLKRLKAILMAVPVPREELP
jgi:hypothetical protein